MIHEVKHSGRVIAQVAKWYQKIFITIYGSDYHEIDAAIYGTLANIKRAYHSLRPPAKAQELTITILQCLGLILWGDNLTLNMALLQFCECRQNTYGTCFKKIERNVQSSCGWFIGIASIRVSSGLFRLATLKIIDKSDVTDQVLCSEKTGFLNAKTFAPGKIKRIGWRNCASCNLRG